MNPLSSAPTVHVNRPAQPGPGMDCWPQPGGQKEIGPGQKEIGPGQKEIGPGQKELGGGPKAPSINIEINIGQMQGDSIQIGGGGPRSGLQLP